MESAITSILFIGNILVKVTYVSRKFLVCTKLLNILTLGIFHRFGFYHQVQLTCFSGRRLTASMYLDLDLVPPVPSGTSGDELSPSGTVAGSISRITPFYTHRLQIFFQRILLCPHWSSSPPAATFCDPFQSQTIAGLVAGSRRMWPTNRHLLVATMSCSANCPDRAITSSFVMWSRHEMPKMLLRHRRLKTSIILVILLFVFHVSLA